RTWKKEGLIKPLVHKEVRQVEGNGQKDKHSSVLCSSSCDHHPIGKEVNLTSKSMLSTSIGEHPEESDSETEDIDGNTARFMASLPNQAGGGVFFLTADFIKKLARS
ncbi:hypothetical protein Tco_0208435, partial [Tanacetum coccineum]